MLVLDINQQLSINDDKTHFNFPFEIKQAGHFLRVEFYFTPSHLEDKTKALEIIRQCYIKYYGEAQEDRLLNHLPLKNFLTISIDSPDSALGTAHRHLKDQCHIISASNSSPGFRNYKIIPGMWNITVSANAIVTDTVNVYLRAEVMYD